MPRGTPKKYEEKYKEENRLQMEVDKKEKITMLELKDIFGHVMKQVPDMATAMEAAERMPQVVDIHNRITGETWSRNPEHDHLNKWVWHWENW